MLHHWLAGSVLRKAKGFPVKTLKDQPSPTPLPPVTSLCVSNEMYSDLFPIYFILQVVYKCTSAVRSTCCKKDNNLTIRSQHISFTVQPTNMPGNWTKNLLDKYRQNVTVSDNTVNHWQQTAVIMLLAVNVVLYDRMFLCYFLVHHQAILTPVFSPPGHLYQVFPRPTVLNSLSLYALIIIIINVDV